MRRLVVILICVFLFIIDNTLLPFFDLKGVYPSALFIFIVFYSLNTDYTEAIKVGVLAGFLQDLYLCQAVGINPLLNMFICLAAVIIGENIFREKALIPVLSLFALSVIKGVLLFIILYLIGLKTDFQDTLYIALYNMVLAILLYKPIFKLLQKPFMKKEWKF
ncbi:rod shape-determining protein MreD [Clostridium thermarum]|uniref:rod shape-determining protein MreD n=1 Tax=Clostridium thermarum TaxID=1716543 RepID=UPI0011225624|nr:rod shape-determining protein MreD [Clostridium thermarum]